MAQQVQQVQQCHPHTNRVHFHPIAAVQLRKTYSLVLLSFKPYLRWHLKSMVEGVKYLMSPINHKGRINPAIPIICIHNPPTPRALIWWKKRPT